MDIFDETELAKLGDRAEALGKLLSTYALALLIATGLVLAIGILIRNRAKPFSETYGKIANVIGSLIGILSASVLFLAIAARALWGKAGGTLPGPPPCISSTDAVRWQCTQDIESHLTLLAHSTVPVSMLLGMAVLFAVLMSAYWLMTAIRDAFK
jgi:hypothetical protein